jgi:hypothetical protein
VTNFKLRLEQEQRGKEKKNDFAGNHAIPNSTPEGTPLFGIATAVIVNFFEKDKRCCPVGPPAAGSVCRSVGRSIGLVGLMFSWTFD